MVAELHAGGRSGTAVDSSVEVVLRNGVAVAVRPLIAGDEAAIGNWFAGLGAETRYARFFMPLERLDRRTTSQLSRVDHLNHEAICAISPDGNTIGIARYIRRGHSRCAEVAVAVADDWRGQGVAGLLLRRVAARAREEDIDCFTATCLAWNHTVIRLLSRLGATSIGPAIAGVVDLRIDLRKPSTEPSHRGGES